MKNQGILYISEAYNVRDTKVASKKRCTLFKPFQDIFRSKTFFRKLGNHGRISEGLNCHL
jgi:hypothetical protein